MVKRWEKMGRKPILKLGGSSKSPNCQPANSSGAVLRNLTQYADSDDGDEGNDRHVSSVGEQKKIDLEVADFLKEIDALAPNELSESSEAEAKDSIEPKHEAIDLSGNSSSSSTSGVQSLWQQCYDEQSGYTYFWNVQTNEVTWETPEDVKRLVGSVPSTSTGGSRMEHANGISRLMMPEDLSHNQPPKKRRKNRDKELEERDLSAVGKEGEIIPITCYGPSSSDEEVPEVAVAIPKKRRLLASQQRKTKEAAILPPPSAQIGPHLPSELAVHPESSPMAPVATILDLGTKNVSSLENGESSDSVLVSTCSASVPCCSRFAEEVRVVANGVSEHGEADPCCQSSDLVTEDGSSESQQPDSNSVSELSPLPEKDSAAFFSPALEDEATGHDLDAAVECVAIKETKAKELGADSHLESLALRHGTVEDNVQEVTLENEPDSTTRREGKKSGDNRGKLTEALQRSLQYESLDCVQHSAETDPSDENVQEQQEAGFADSSPELPAPSTDSVSSLPCTSAKLEEVQDLSIPNDLSEEQSGDGKLENKENEVHEVEEDKSSLADDELDLEEIERALDSALERNKASIANTNSVDLSAPSTSRSQLGAVRDRSAEERTLPSPQVSNSQNNELTVEDLSALLFAKLAVLGMGKMEFSTLALLHVQLETRFLDWQQGQLSSNYLMERLKEADVLLKQYESRATPGGWTCNWDRENGRYFYMCNRTGRAQWEFPSAASSHEKKEGDDEELEAASSSEPQVGHGKRSAAHLSTAGQHPLVTSSTAEELFRFAAKGTHAKGIHLPKPVALPPPPPPEEETAEVEPQCSSSPTPPPNSPPVPQPPKSPPPPPPDSTEVEGKTPDVDMDIDDGNSKESEDNPSSSSAVETSFQVVTFLEREQSAFYEALGDTWLPNAQTSHPAAAAADPSPVVAPPLVSVPSASTVSTSEIVQPYDLAGCYAWAQPAVYGGGPSEVNGCDTISTCGGVAPLVVDQCHNLSEPGTSSSTQDSAAGSSGMASKKEKKKSKLATGLALKKKKISSLVEKWQKIKKEQLQEELTMNGDQDGKISTTM